MQRLEQYAEQWHQRADRVGASSLAMFDSMQRLLSQSIVVVSLMLRMQWLSKRAVRQVLYRQIYFTGIQNVLWVVLLAVAIGVLIIYNIVVFSRQIGDLSWVSVLIHNVLIQEIAPLIVAMLLLARSGVAIVTEIGYMHVRGEDAFLQTLGVSAEEYLYLPRLIAFALSGVVLTLLFVVIALWLGGVVVVATGKLTLTDYLFLLQQSGSLQVMLVMIAKGALFPVLICMLLLDQACQVGRDPNQLPVRATQGVLAALLVILFLDALWVMGAMLL